MYRVTSPKSAKRSTFSYKMDPKWSFYRRVKGTPVRFKGSTFSDQMDHFLGILHLPKIDSDYRPVHLIKYIFRIKFKSGNDNLNFKKFLKKSDLSLALDKRVKGVKMLEIKAAVLSIGCVKHTASSSSCFTKSSLEKQHVDSNPESRLNSAGRYVKIAS